MCEYKSCAKYNRQSKMDENQATVPKPDITWLEGSYSLEELLKKFPLPVVVACDTSRSPFHRFNFDLTQELLLFKQRKIRKVSARNLCVSQGKYMEVGETLLIPEDYRGWFVVLQRPTENTAADDAIPHTTTVEALAQTKAEKFLVGGDIKISGLQVLDRTDGHLQHQSRYILPGDVLTKGKIYIGDTKKKHRRFFRKPKVVSEKFLLCMDESDREVLLPFAQKGIFYEISSSTGRTNRPVMQMSDIVAKNIPPRIVKLVFGRFPVTPCSFTGLMSLEQAYTEHSLVASTIKNVKNILLEIPVTAGLYFRVAKRDEKLINSEAFKNAMTHCCEKASTYMRNIKVCYDFSESCMEDVQIDRERKSDVETSFNEEFIKTTYDGKNENEKPSYPHHYVTDYVKNDNLCKRKKDSEDKICDSDYMKMEAVNRNTEQTLNGSASDGSGSLIAEQTATESKPKEIDLMTETTDNTDDVNRPRLFSMNENTSNGYVRKGELKICLGNSYLKIPMYRDTNNDAQPGNSDHASHPTNQRDNTSEEIPTLSFEEETAHLTNASGTIAEDSSSRKSSFAELSECPPDFVPPPPPCVMYYCNVQDPPSSIKPIPCSGGSPHSILSHFVNQAPNHPPPPPPCHSSSSSSGNGSASGMDSARSSFGNEYAVPTTQASDSSPIQILPSQEVLDMSSRRPSTFVFHEMFAKEKTVFQTFKFCHKVCDVTKRQSLEKLDETNLEDNKNELEEDENDDSDPIYENIEGLVEIFETLKRRKRKTKADTSFEENPSAFSPEEEELQFPSQPSTDMAQDDPDDLPLGATARNSCLMEESSISSSQPDSGVDEICDSDVFRKVHFQEFSEILAANGIRKSVIEKLRLKTIDGDILIPTEADDSALKECFMGLSLIDLKKISMLVRSWKP
ncbi:hypothetical protein CHS0354_038800 [Potamilus streckersoni]|uniref:CABIT domain-containing protein n=1 Tax=Potamilus streckersoni TaxID=2493646 RepID=A0AAE0WCE2_9BIVA|nr:hypothetical protein CHS0354_038800 [Potamilus streckersoni]